MNRSLYCTAAVLTLLTAFSSNVVAEESSANNTSIIQSGGVTLYSTSGRAYVSNSGSNSSVVAFGTDNGNLVIVGNRGRTISVPGNIVVRGKTLARIPSTMNLPRFDLHKLHGPAYDWNAWFDQLLGDVLSPLNCLRAEDCLQNFDHLEEIEEDVTREW